MSEMDAAQRSGSTGTWGGGVSVAERGLSMEEPSWEGRVPNEGRERLRCTMAAAMVFLLMGQEALALQYALQYILQAILHYAL